MCNISHYFRTFGEGEGGFKKGFPSEKAQLDDSHPAFPTMMKFPLTTSLQKRKRKGRENQIGGSKKYK